MKLALEYCPNFSTSLHVPRRQNERLNMHRKATVSFEVLFILRHIRFSISAACEVVL